EDIASARNFPGINLSEEMIMGPGGFPLGKLSEVVYEEDIYVGYRYFSTFGVDTSFPFGFGLSYTEFAYADLATSSTHFEGSLEVGFTITNTGDVAGKEVVQLYISAPGKAMNKPVVELKKFAKTGLLQPGSSEAITFTLSAQDLASYV